jgi:hypothetical protein
MRAMMGGALLGLLMLGSCQTMSAEECASADWRTIGREDGAAGAALSKFSDREQSCAKKGFTADMAAYRIGREAGLAEFCQPQSGWQAGLAGYAYAGVCPPGLEPGFLSGYRDGTAAYQAKQAVSSAESALDSARSEVERLTDKIAAFDAAARDSSKSQQERDQARQRANELRRDRDDARDKVRDAQRGVYDAQRALDRAHIDLAGRWGPW